MLHPKRARSLALAVIAALTALAAVASSASAAGEPTPPFWQCPGVGNNNRGCSQLIVANPDGTFDVKTDPNAPPNGYDGAEDTLIGVQNISGKPLASVNLASTTKSIFAFDGDGICNPSQWPSAPSTTPPGCPGPQGFGPTGYEGPNTTFSNISSNQMTGTLNFTKPIASGRSAEATAYFALEEALASGQLLGGAGGHPIPSGLTVKNTAASVNLTCVGANNCNGKLYIVLLLQGKKVVFVPVGVSRNRHKKPKVRRVIIGSTNVAIPAGNTELLNVTLNARGRKLLNQRGNLLAQLSVVLNQTSGKQTTFLGKVRFHHKQKKHRKH
jgi:hypothetical protein